MTATTILKDCPFKNKIHISKIKQFKIGSTKEAFHLIDISKNSYKLRVCKTIHKARELENNIKNLNQIFPDFHGRDKQYLLLSYIKGYRPPTLLDKDTLFEIGRLQALVNQTACSGDASALDRKFLKTLSKVAQYQIISIPEEKTIQTNFESLRAEIDYRFCLDIRDTSLDNFIKTSSKMYYVDENGIGNLGGVGLVRLFRPLGRKPTLLSKKHKQYLQTGYESINKTFWTPEYLSLVSLYDMVNRLYTRFRPK